MANILNLVVIEPLKLLFEVVFYFVYNLTESSGISIIVLSLTLNLILMPLYKKADEIQNQENETQKRLKPGIDKIKKAFKGDEQYMILQTYYRQNHYKPIYSLRSITSLLLEIPFFIAAYSFISNLDCIKTSSFLFINDLGKPDGLLFGSINVLPIAMTLVNVASCYIYTKGQPFKSKIQLYLMALVFLILLYNAPAGLSFYYLLNNLFSLIKNAISKLNNRKTIVGIVLIAASSLLIFYLINNMWIPIIAKTLIIFIVAVMLIISFLQLKNIEINMKLNDKENSKHIFFICTLLLFVLIGLLIPSQVINASPEEFIDRTNIVNPLQIVFNTSLISFGLFVLWFNVYYSLMNNNIKKIMNYVIMFIVLASIMNHLFFKNDLGLINNALLFEKEPVFTKENLIINLLLIVVIFVVSILISKRKLCFRIVLVMLLGFSAMFGMNAVSINRTYKNIENRKETFYGNDAYLSLSKNNKNVVVIMLDRAINMYFPYIIEENPKLKEQFSGFTYYPNTVSFGRVTNIATPSLFGGYEYTPYEINKKDTQLLVDKQNEALKVMPTIFDSNGYNVTVFDPPYAGYSWIPDISIYDELKNTKAYITEDKTIKMDSEKLSRDFVIYGFARTMPNILFNVLYDSGNYMSVTDKTDMTSSLKNFIGKYEVLCNLKDMTFIDDNNGSFVMLQNSSTHQPVMLQLPDYTVASKVDNSLFEEINTNKKSIVGDTILLTEEEQISHYHVNMASYLRIGEWLDYLKDNHIYDNTRIIIVSDHGSALGLKNDLTCNGKELMAYNPVLLVKDFDSKNLRIDDSFMTLADITYLATKDVINNPINPFTGNAIKEKNKNNEVFHIFSSSNFEIETNNGTTFINDDIWFDVHDNCLDPSNWSVNEDLSNK